MDRTAPQQKTTPSAPAELRIGEFRIWQNLPSQTSIYRDNGEGGVFNTDDLAKAIGEFYDRHF